MKKIQSPTVLVILDGFGYAKPSLTNAISQAHMPHFQELLADYPVTLLKASGMAVGLPEGQIGNSEVGHLTIGSGSVILQPLTMINLAIQDGTFFTNSILRKALQNLKEEQKTLHLMGILSDGNVHGSLDHLIAFLKVAQQIGLQRVVVHPFLDGRDVAPQSAHEYLEKLELTLQEVGIGIIGSIHGRFYAMDRNRHWNLVKKSYQVLTEPQTKVEKNWQTVLESSYHKKITDEFLEPTQLDPAGYIRPDDGVIFWNFRPDRARQLTQLFLNPPADLHMKKIPLSFFITPVSYGPEYKTTVLYQKPRVPQTLTKLLHDKGYSLFAVAETEKYAHVTYFFNGGREQKLEHEQRVLVPSIEKRDYLQHPEMSADIITEVVLHSLQTDPADFYVINYANADMIGHTGNLAATIKAVECLDKQLGILYKEVVQKRNGTLYITADHGNAEQMFDAKTNQSHTAHTANPVYFLMVQQDLKGVQDQLPLEELSDIAPFIVHNLEGYTSIL